MRKCLPQSYYLNHDLLMLSRDLLGRGLLTKNEKGEVSGGIITEVEAYMGPFDKASHAFAGRRTLRNEVMYGEGGHAYLYLCYGLHILFNVVTNIRGLPHAILIRSIEPFEGVELIQKRRGQKKNLGKGPGVVSKALGLNLKDNGASLSGPRVWIEQEKSSEGIIESSPRIGIDYAKEHALLPWRFCLKTQNPLPC